MIQGKGALHLFATACVFAGVALLPAPTAQRGRPLEPIASFVATIYWARADAAFDEGRLDVGLARAERALALDPAPSEGWSWLAGVLVHRFGAPEFENSPAARRAWIEAGLAVLARGEAESREPEELAFHAGLILAFVGSLPGDVLDWPGGARGAWLEAAEHFERAQRLGHPRAEEVAQGAMTEVHWPSPEPSWDPQEGGGKTEPIRLEHSHEDKD